MSQIQLSSATKREKFAMRQNDIKKYMKRINPTKKIHQTKR